MITSVPLLLVRFALFSALTLGADDGHRTAPKEKKGKGKQMKLSKKR